MSQDKPKKKKVVTTKKTVETNKSATITRPTAKRKTSGTGRSGRKRTSARRAVAQEPLTFGRENYMIMGLGVLLLAIGMLLMAGGKQSSPEVWEPERIYSFRRTVLAPVVILLGIAAQFVAIFRRRSA